MCGCDHSSHASLHISLCAGSSLVKVLATDSDLLDNTITYSISYANFNFSIDPDGTVRTTQAFPTSDAIQVSDLIINISCCCHGNT